MTEASVTSSARRAELHFRDVPASETTELLPEVRRGLTVCGRFIFFSTRQNRAATPRLLESVFLFDFHSQKHSTNNAVKYVCVSEN